MKIKNEKTGKIEDIRLPKEFKNKWVKALRSGDYSQGKLRLENSCGDMCCLGVACRIVHPKLILKEFAYINDSVAKKTTKVPGILKGINSIIPEKLTKMNDSGKHSFKSIASYIERYL